MTWNADGSQLSRDQHGRVTGVTQPNQTFSNFERDEKGEINLVKIGTGKTFERQPAAAGDTTPVWKSTDGMTAGWRGTIGVSDDGTIRTRDAQKETIIKRGGEKIEANAVLHHDGSRVYADKFRLVHSTASADRHSTTIEHSADDSVRRVEISAPNAGSPQISFASSDGKTFVCEENGR